MNITAIKNNFVGFGNVKKTYQKPQLTTDSCKTARINANGLSDSLEISQSALMTPKKALEIFNQAGINGEILEDGTICIQSYEPNKAQMKILGGKEKDLFRHVSKIDGYANFERSELEDLGSLKEISKTVIFTLSKIKDTRGLKYIGKDAYYNNSKVETIGKVTIGRDAHFENSIVDDVYNANVGRVTYW